MKVWPLHSVDKTIVEIREFPPASQRGWLRLTSANLVYRRDSRIFAGQILRKTWKIPSNSYWNCYSQFLVLTRRFVPLAILGYKLVFFIPEKNNMGFRFSIFQFFGWLGSRNAEKCMKGMECEASRFWFRWASPPLQYIRHTWRNVRVDEAP